MSGRRGDDFDVRLLDGRLESYAYTVRPEEDGRRLDRFLAGRLSWRSRTAVRRMIDGGQVTLAGRSARAARRVWAGETVTVALPRPRRDEALAPRGALPELPVLYEDDDLIAVDKPAGMAVHPSGRLLHNTVITLLHRRYRDFDDPARDRVPKLCHRLDLETSGVLLVAKHVEALRVVQAQFERRTVGKEYLALVHGAPDDEGLVDLPIGPAHAGAVRSSRAIRHDVGLPSRTRFAVVRRWPAHALVRLELLTGRHHQIRVHMAAIGHPVVGDKVYGHDADLFLRFHAQALTADDERQLELPRQALHSHALTFTHPDGTTRRIESAWPRDLAAYTTSLRADRPHVP